MSDSIYFVVFPYLAVILAVGVGLYRYFINRFSYSSMSSQFLENRALFWGSVPWHYGIVLILLSHLFATVIPRFWASLHSDPTRMLIIELVGGILGFLTLLGIVIVVLRRIFSPKVAVVTTVMDWILLADLLLQVAAGLYIAFFYRWGSLWYEYTAAPWIASLASLTPHSDYIIPLPWIVRFHMVNGFVVIGLFPFTRLVHIFTVPISYLWRPYQVVMWYRSQTAGTGGAFMEQGGRAGGTGEPGEISRRSFFLKVIIGTLTSIGGLILAIPYLRAIFRSSPPTASAWSEVTDIDSLPVGQPVDLKFEMVSQDAYIHGATVRTVWVIKHSADNLTVFSPICPHLGCYYTWDAQAKLFECPCHGSVYTITGKVIAGPAPRPLDTLPYKIENGKLFVQWERFKVAIPEKVRV